MANPTLTTPIKDCTIGNSIVPRTGRMISMIFAPIGIILMLISLFYGTGRIPASISRRFELSLRFTLPDMVVLPLTIAVAVSTFATVPLVNND